MVHQRADKPEEMVKRKFAACLLLPSPMRAKRDSNRSNIFQMIDFKLVAAFIGWTTTTFVAHYSIKRILVATTPDGAEVWLKVLSLILSDLTSTFSAIIRGPANNMTF